MGNPPPPLGPQVERVGPVGRGIRGASSWPVDLERGVGESPLNPFCSISTSYRLLIIICVLYIVGMDDSEEEELAPTPKVLRLKSERALRPSPNSGKYPPYLGIEGPIEPKDPKSTEWDEYLSVTM